MKDTEIKQVRQMERTTAIGALAKDVDQNNSVRVKQIAEERGEKTVSLKIAMEEKNSRRLNAVTSFI